MKHDKTFGAFEKVYYDYFRLMGEIWDELVRKILVAQKECCSQWAAVSQGGAPRTAHEPDPNKYAEAVRAAWDESQVRYIDAYTSYLKTYKDAWAATKWPEVSPQTLTIVLESAVSVAGSARNTIGNLSLIAWAGVPPWHPTNVRQSAPA